MSYKEGGKEGDHSWGEGEGGNKRITDVGGGEGRKEITEKRERRWEEKLLSNMGEGEGRRKEIANGRGGRGKDTLLSS